jgi:collagen type III alpha
MGLLSRLTSAVRGDASVSLVAEPLAGGALLGIVGESHYQPALERMSKLAVRGVPPLSVTTDVAVEEPDLLWFQAVLVREPDNPYDANAIAVYSPAGKIGHLSRDDAERYQEVLAAVESRGAQGGACAAFLRRSGDYWGAVLALSYPDICLSELEP